jgi:tRNA pseudouridine55 synthase
MHTLDELREVGSGAGEAALDALLLPLEEGLAGHPRLVVDDDEAERLRQGQPVFFDGAPEGGCIAVDGDGRAVALVERGADGCLRSRRGFNPVQRR